MEMLQLLLRMVHGEKRTICVWFRVREREHPARIRDDARAAYAGHFQITGTTGEQGQVTSRCLRLGSCYVEPI